jgi:hypothetical protein
MSLIVLARTLREAAEAWGRHNTEDAKFPPKASGVFLTGGNEGEEAFAVAFRLELLDFPVGTRQYTVTISESTRR